MFYRFVFSIFFLVSYNAFSIEPSGLHLVDTLSDFATPESVIYDTKRDVVYVSNIDGSSVAKDGNGFITRIQVSPTGGKLLERKWVEGGLHAPKGMAIHGNRLYVSDIDHIVEIDIEQAKIIARFAADKAQFLNDVVATKEGDIYISDMFTNTIYRLPCKGCKTTRTVESWIQAASLNAPNGLLIIGDKLLVASWGERSAQGFETSTLGRIYALSLDDKQQTNFSRDDHIGNLDGMVLVRHSKQQAQEQRFHLIVSDWVDGALWSVTASGKASKILDLNQGSADIGYIEQTRLLLVPMMQDNQLKIYRVD